ncbi:MAG: hypothetical protein IPG80_15220 [Anaerolineales bacterium]|uniref:hypothetical protein n=1 Tax=Candidatus Villigracilis vicinus TaxID=3140679 RepID=UPI00313699E5|nr:hypothetical protein [Anaerolineales bacterium]
MEKIMEVLGFDDADLGSNRLGQLTQKQKDLLAEKAKSHKSFNTIIGVIIAVVFGGALLTGLGAPILAAVGGSLLESGKVTTEALLTLIPIICVVLFVLVIFGGILIVILKVVFDRANKKVDTTVRRVEGTVNFIWVERRERNTSKTGPTYKTVRVLEMRIGGETFNVNNELPNVINQGEEWIFYYTNHPFKFLSAEKNK